MAISGVESQLACKQKGLCSKIIKVSKRQMAGVVVVFVMWQMRLNYCAENNVQRKVKEVKVNDVKSREFRVVAVSWRRQDERLQKISMILAESTNPCTMCVGISEISNIPCQNC